MPWGRNPNPGSQICMICTLRLDGSESFVLVELQGKIENVGQGGKMFDLRLEEQSPVIYVGNQKLVGKAVPLPKPLAVCRAPAGECRQLSVVGVVREKFIFSERPRVAKASG